MTRRSKIFITLAIIASTLAVTYQAIGGRLGLSLLMIRVFTRVESAPYRSITWKTAPAIETASAAPRPPNILLIVVDDLGYADLTVHGSGVAEGRVPTPNIDSLAQQGVRFDIAYASNATCAPSRAGIMTGRYPTRSGYEFTPTAPRFMKLVTTANPNSSRGDNAIYFAEREKDQQPFEEMALPQSEVTLATLLKNIGYRTLHIGKWHLGDTPNSRAYSRGFDESLSLQYGASMYLPEDDPRVVNVDEDLNPIDLFIRAAAPWGVRFNAGEIFKPDRYLTDYLTDEAIKAIEANQQRPFFLYLAYNAPHTPLQATREDYDALGFIEDHSLRVYAAMIRSLDRNIGRVLAALRERGIADDTLVIFTSDNGAPHYINLSGRNAPFRGWKASYFEGGIRVPLFMRWPAGLPRGATASAPVAHIDIFATAATAAGAALPVDRKIDGVNLLPIARGETTERPHKQLFWRTDRYLTLREGDWKLQSTELPRVDRLYDLANDPLETRNLATAEPARLAAMKATLLRIDAEQAKPLWPSLGAGYIPIDRTLKDPPRKGEDFVYFSN